MYILFDDEYKKIKGLYVDKSKAIIMRNYLEYEKSEEEICEEKSPFLILEADDDHFDRECSQTWTHIDLTNVPFDFKLDLKKDLHQNNWIFQKFDEEQKKIDTLEAHKKDKFNHDCEDIQEIIEAMKTKYKTPLLEMLQNIEDYEKESNDIHAEVIHCRKKVKKGVMDATQMNSISQKENDIKKELGSKRRKLTSQIKSIVSEIEKILKNKNIHAYVDLYNYNADKEKIHVLTIRLLNYDSSFPLYLMD